jgi:hypothetical protein
VIPKSAALGVLFMYAGGGRGSWRARRGGAPAARPSSPQQPTVASHWQQRQQTEIPASARILLNEAASWKIYDNAIDF